MARPEKNTVEYFPFYCEDGNKMFYLEETYGNDGFATFIKLLRELAKTNYHYLDLSKPTTQMFLSAKCKISKETLLSIIKDLVDLGKFDKILWEENCIVWCQDFVDSIQDAYFKRKNKCITYDGLLLLLNSLGVRKPSKSKLKDAGNTQTILDYTKLEEIKENKSLTLESDFVIFWNKYNKKNDFKKCKDKFLKLKANEIENILKVLDKYILSTPDVKFRKNPLTWLNGECWKDLIESKDVLSISNENIIRFISNVNSTPQEMEESKFLAMQERNLAGGYIYKIIN